MTAKEPASIRYKNPGAMWGSALAIKWGAKKKAVALKDGTGQNNNIAVFPTYVQGICAQLDLWRTSKNYRNKRFADAIAIWSGGNSVESYIAFVLKRVPGMTRNTVMNDAFWSSPSGIAFLKAQAWHEAGKKYPAPDGDWIEAQRRVFDVAEQPPHDQQSDEIGSVQRRLDRLGYHEVGTIDGKWGGRTAGAIAAFKNDRHISGPAIIDQALLTEITKAEGESWARPIAKERGDASEATVTKQAPEIVPVKRGRLAALVASIISGILAFLNAIADYFHDALAWVVSLKEYAAGAPGWVWFALAGGLAFVMYLLAKHGAKGIVKAFQEGKRA
jgi:hypothetical protein